MALIVDASMPKGKCWWEENGDEHECQFFPCWGNVDDCPIIGEIPDKHGELKDEMDILRIFDKYLPKVDDDTNALLCEILAEIHLQAPTVLEATE